MLLCLLGYTMGARIDGSDRNSGSHDVVQPKREPRGCAHECEPSPQQRPAASGNATHAFEGEAPKKCGDERQTLFVDGNPNSAWSRRFDDLLFGYINDVSGGAGPDALSVKQLTLCRHCATMQSELERLDARLSNDMPVDMDRYCRTAGHLRRHFETLGIERKQRDVSEINPLEYAKQYEANADEDAEVS
jgi:hypothetical protein